MVDGRMLQRGHGYGNALAGGYGTSGIVLLGMELFGRDGDTLSRGLRAKDTIHTHIHTHTHTHTQARMHTHMVVTVNPLGLSGRFRWFDRVCLKFRFARPASSDRKRISKRAVSEHPFEVPIPTDRRNLVQRRSSRGRAALMDARTIRNPRRG